MRPLRKFLCLSLALLGAQLLVQTTNLEAQQPPNPLVAPPPHAKPTHLKHVLVIGETKGFEHDSVSAAMAAIYDMGKESGLWDAMLRTDTELLTKKDMQRNAKNLNYFDAVIFASSRIYCLSSRKTEKASSEFTLHWTRTTPGQSMAR